MEREKQKQLDKEREQKEREEYLRLKRLEEERILNEQPDDGVPRLPAKSKFVRMFRSFIKIIIQISKLHL